MRFSELLKTAFTTMRLNKRRTFLTMIGIIIGIGSVITILSLGNGLRHEAVDSLAKDEAGRRSQFFSYTPNDYENDKGDSDPFSAANIEYIEKMDGVDEVKIGSDFSSMGGISDDSPYVEVGRQNGEDMLQIKKVEQSEGEILYGRPLLADDGRATRRFITVDEGVARKFFGPDIQKALGSVLTIDDTLYTIVGIYAGDAIAAAEELEINFFGEGFSETIGIEVPGETYDTLNPEIDDYQYEITVYFTHEADTTPLNKDIEKYLTSSGKEKDNGTYSYFDMSEMMDEIGKVLQSLTFFITAIAGISLFIAGVGVMNMMYISVAERTKEIGIRRSLGATAKSIQWQFLTEGIAITLIGGLIGYTFGAALSYLIALMLPFSSRLDIGSALFAVGVSTIVGIAFSVFPAQAAAKKNVVEILR